MSQRMKFLAGVLALGLLGIYAGQAVAQDYEPFSINARAGVAVPTGSVADVAKAGFDWGFGLQYTLGRVELGANFDLSKHNLKDEVRTALDSPNSKVDVMHYIASFGYHFVRPQPTGFRFSANLGAGAMSFKVKDGPALETETAFAINAGAQIGYGFSPNFEIFANLQGDIGFIDKDNGNVFGPLTELGLYDGSSAWVWPLTAGLKIRI